MPGNTTQGASRKSRELIDAMRRYSPEWPHVVEMWQPDDAANRVSYTNLNQVESLTPNEYRETLLSQLKPVWTPGLIGTHTWNVGGDFEVIDGLRLVEV